jgi:hypothetical protein
VLEVASQRETQRRGFAAVKMTIVASENVASEN